MSKPKKPTHSNAFKVEAVANAGTASIRIVDYIGGEGNDDYSIRSVVDKMLAQQVTAAEVYINSYGGSVFAATEMVNQLNRFASVSVTVGALAASAATYITSSFPTKGPKNSQYMIHKPASGAFGNVDKLESTIKLLQGLTEDYKAKYVSKTGMTPEQIDELWAKGDYWMTAAEALKLGFIDEIIGEEVEISEEDIVLLEACAAPIIPQAKAQTENDHKNQNTKMERLEIIAALGLPANATDDQIKVAIAANKTKAEAHDRQKESAEALRKLQAKQLVEAAVKEKRIPADQEADYLVLAEADYERTEKIIGVKTPLPNPTAHINTNVGKIGTQDPRAAWTLEEWLDKDPQAFEQLQNTDPEKFKQLNDAYYAKK
ncbi:ATP-dependent Clp protease proteolytic subunit [compost metagenome]